MLTKKIITLFSICTLTAFSTVKAQFDSLYYSVNGENFLQSKNADVVVLAGFMTILGPKVIKAFENGR